ncbi:MAG: glycosyltransferase [Terriglobia bacterium]|jgi:1,2-diacylglycerol 3-beta-galactosyltransferase
MATMVKVDLIYFEAGGGHRAAAQALELALRERHPWHVRLVNLQELLQPMDVVSKITGIQTQDVYNRLLAKDWTRGIAYLLPVLHATVRLGHGEEVRLIENYWRNDPPDLAVSLIPHFNRALRQALGSVAPASPFVTILTDLADYPPHFWIERQDQFFICGSDRAVEQARELGIDADRVFRASGMILHPRFYQSPVSDRGSARQSLGLDPELPTGLVMFGGSGSSAMLEIAERLEECSAEIQLISICGKNEQLADMLRLRRRRLRHFVLGYTTEVQRYMYLSDFFIGKPGPGSLSEAVTMNLPVIVERNPRTMPQERYNIEWILENELGIVVPSFRIIAEAVRQMVAPGKLARFRAQAAKMNNRAVFEIPDILKSVMSIAASGGCLQT